MAKIFRRAVGVQAPHGIRLKCELAFASQTSSQESLSPPHKKGTRLGERDSELKRA